MQKARRRTAAPADAPVSGKAARHYVGDVGAPLQGPAQVAAVGFPLVLLACLIGFAVGAFVWGMLQLAGYLTGLIWEMLPTALPEAFDAWWLPIAVCTAGGLVIGLWTRAFHNAPEPLETVMGSVRKTGGYHLHVGDPAERPRERTEDAAANSKVGEGPAEVGGIVTPGEGSAAGERVDDAAAQPAKRRPVALISAVSFLLPLAFGGSVGPEAGLSGLIAAGCTWIGNLLKRAGIAAKSTVDLTVSATLSAVFGTPFLGIAAAVEEDDDASEAVADSAVAADTGGMARAAADAGIAAANATIADTYTFRRPAKVMLYTAAGLGAFGGVVLLVELFGASSGLPRLDSIEAGLVASLAWTVPLALLGWLLALFYHASERAFRMASGCIGCHPVLKPVIAGAVIGIAACALPDVLFSGEDQVRGISGTWVQTGAVVLLATGVLKLAATPLCLNFGWCGGHFFPCIFAGVSFGYGLAALTGLDPMLCVTAVTTALMAGIMRRPFMAIALLIMCFPLDGILVIGIAALIGATLPMPRRLFANA